MRFTEKNLEDIIFESDKELLDSRGLLLKGKVLRQLRIGNYGIADLVTVERPDFVPMSERNTESFHAGFFTVTIYELKQDKIGIATLLQAIRYAKGIKSWFEKSKHYDYYSIDFKIVLIGSQIDSSSKFMYLSDICKTAEGEELIQILTYEYKIDGIYFYDKSSWSLTNEGF